MKRRYYLYPIIYLLYGVMTRKEPNFFSAYIWISGGALFSCFISFITTSGPKNSESVRYMYNVIYKWSVGIFYIGIPCIILFFMPPVAFILSFFISMGFGSWLGLQIGFNYFLHENVDEFFKKSKEKKGEEW